jgi:hypothetical protein
MAEAEDVVTKGRFAVLAGVSQPRVSQWLAEGKISGDAIVGSGPKARIRVAVAQKQLRRNLDARSTSAPMVALVLPPATTMAPSKTTLSVPDWSN